MTHNSFDFPIPVVRLLRQRGLWHHVLQELRGRPGPEEEQEEAQARATSHESAQQRGRKKGKKSYNFILVLRPTQSYELNAASERNGCILTLLQRLSN